MADSIKTSPPNFDRRAHCAGEEVDQKLDELAHRSPEATHASARSEANRIRVEAYEAMQGDSAAASATRNDLKKLSKDPNKFYPVLELLSLGEPTRALPVARTEFAPNSDQVSSVTFDQACLDNTAKYGTLEFDLK